MKSLGFILAILLVGGGGWVGWKRWQQDQASKTAVAAASARPVEATVETRNIRFAVSAAGEIVPAGSLNQQIGWSGQRPFLLPGSLEENLLLASLPCAGCALPTAGAGGEQKRKQEKKKKRKTKKK